MTPRCRSSRRSRRRDPTLRDSVAQEAITDSHARHRRDAREPRPGRLADVAAHVEQLGLQPARRYRYAQRRAAQARVDAAARRWRLPGRHAARPRRHPVLPEPRRRHASAERRDRRLHLGVPSRGTRGRRRVLPGGRDEPQSRDLRQPDSRQRRRRLCLRAERTDRRASLGNAHPRLPNRREEQLGPDHRQRQGHLGSQLRARGRPRGVRHHGVRRENRPGAVAHAHDPETRRARRRNLGRHSVREALARRHVDGAELRSGAEPHLRRHVGHRSRAEVHARRQPASSTSITTRRSRSTPTPARSSGTSSTSSITGISIIRSSGCSSTPSSRRMRPR